MGGWENPDPHTLISYRKQLFLGFRLPQKSKQKKARKLENKKEARKLAWLL